MNFFTKHPNLTKNYFSFSCLFFFCGGGGGGGGEGEGARVSDLFLLRIQT